MERERQATAASIQVARLALVRSLAASHMQRGPAAPVPAPLRQSA